MYIRAIREMNKQTGEKIMYKLVIEDIENIVKAENYERPELSGFSESCYDMNTEGDLAVCLVEFNHDDAENSADKSDCNEWNITPEQWFNEIEKALTCLIDDRINE